MTWSSDVKPDNILICIDHEDAAITHLLQEIPSATYEPRIEPDLSPNPIITVKSQPLPNFGLREDMSNLTICLIDYGNGEQSHVGSVASYLFRRLQQHPPRTTYRSRFNLLSCAHQKLSLAIRGPHPSTFGRWDAW
jgi:hypothetical protein